MVNIKRRTIWAKIFVFCATLTFFSDAYPVRYPQSHEIKTLPRYCQAKLGHTPKSEAKMWGKKFGRNVWTGFHHYCQYVNLEQRYYKTNNPEIKKRNLKDIIKGMKGQLKAYGPRFILRHDAYYRIGWAQAKLGRPGEAIVSFDTAIRINPKFGKAYRALSDLYRDNDQLDKALETINSGIKNVPKSKSLKRRKSQLEKLMAKQKSGV